jgi:hypothetical protein
MQLKQYPAGPVTTILMVLALLVTVADLPAAKYAGEPFYLGVGAQALAMGGAFSAEVSDVTSGFWNPAGLSGVKLRQVAFMHAETFGSLLNHDYLAGAFPLDTSKNRTLAFSLTRLGGGGIKIAEWQGEIPTVLREESHADYQLIASYAFKYNNRLSVGLNAKFIYRDIPTSSAYGLGADLGLRYKIANSLRASLLIRDFTTTLLAYDTGTKESIYPTVIAGLSTRQEFDDFSLTLTADGDFHFENLRDNAQYWSGSVSLDTHFGAELGFLDKLFARAGYDTDKLTLGGGLKLFPFQVDFAYLSDNDLDDSFRVSALFFWK